MNIAPYSDEIKDEIIALILNIQREEFGLSITLADQPDLQNVTEFYVDSGGGFWVWEQEGDILGTIALLNIGYGKYALRKMFVKAGFRGGDMDIAKSLLSFAEEWALHQKKATAIYLGTTERFLAAHKFYRKNGYVEIPSSSLPGAFPIMFVDKLFFMKSL